jgi:SSS family transporter
VLAIFIPIYILITLAIGFWASKRVKSSTDFTLAGKSLSTSFVGVTIFATWFGSSYVMGNPSYFVTNGISSFVALIVSGFVCLILVGYFYAKKLYQMNIVTVGDFFRIRYNKRLDSAVSGILIFTYPHWIAAQFLALAYLFQSVLGIDVDYGILLSASIVVLYTYIGGMWAVSYTDMLQSILIIVGLLFLLSSVLDQTGGIATLFVDKPSSFYSPFPQEGIDNWSEYIATILAVMLGAIPAQEVYQRIFSAKSVKAAIWGTYLAAFLLMIFAAVPMVIALGAAQLHPELMAVNDGEAILPSMVSQFAGIPLQILFYGALISAILSTSSGAMLAPATVIGENLIKPNLPNITDKKLLLYTRLSVILVAVVSCYFAFSDLDIVELVVASLAPLLVCIFAPFTFGLFWKKSSLFGAWSAILIGGLVWLLCYLFETRIDATIYGLLASCLAMVAGSLLLPDKTKIVNKSF